jgi:hypothetical protein
LNGQNSKMAATRPNIFLGGLRLLLTNKRTLLWSYLALLAVGLIGGASLHARIGPFLDHSLAAQKLAGSIDLGYYAELFQHVNEHNPGSGPVTAALTLLSVLLSFFFAAGILYIFVAGEKPRLATILRVGVEYFWRFFRLALFAAVIAGLILGPLGWLRTLYLKHADEKYVEAAYDFRFVLTLILLLLIAVALRLWFDMAEVYVVQMGRSGDRRVRRSLGPSLRLCRQHFGHLFLGYFAAGTLGVLGFAFFLWVWAISQTSHLILPVFLWSQIGLLFLLASRIWQRAIVTTLVLASEEPTQTVILVQPGPLELSPPTYPDLDSKPDGSIPLPPADGPSELPPEPA